MTTYKDDVEMLKANLINVSKYWDGKSCVLELKEADYNWRQMEWWAFYFEYKVKNILVDKFTFPGDRYDNVTFDLKGSINWDLKAKAIKSDDHKVILNDKSAMEQSVEKSGYHGEIIALCDVEYNDVNWSFRKWQAELKGKWDFDFEKNKDFSLYKYCVTNLSLVGFLLLIFTKNDLQKLDVFEKSKIEKYMFDLEKSYLFENYKIEV